MLLVHFSGVRNGCMSTFWAQKIVLKKLMKFTRFFVFLLLKIHKTCKFHQFFKCNFLGPKYAYNLISHAPRVGLLVKTDMYRHPRTKNKTQIHAFSMAHFLCLSFYNLKNFLQTSYNDSL